MSANDSLSYCSSCMTEKRVEFLHVWSSVPTIVHSVERLVIRVMRVIVFYSSLMVIIIDPQLLNLFT
jgi:hypothetical protein